MTFIRLITLIGAIAFLVAWFAWHATMDNVASASSAATMRCTVVSVWDGDGPIHCREGGKIRLTAIAARQLDETCSPGHPCLNATGAEAQAALRQLAQGQTLMCEPTGLSRDRIRAWCWRPDGTELNCAMLRSGTVAYWQKFDRWHRMCADSV
jgi:endonuclease YncB( thermonuclease family)